MHRLARFIAVLFALVSVSLATASGVFAADNGPDLPSIVAAGPATLCANDDDGPLKAPTFKPCAKKVNGLGVLCHADPGLLPAVLGAPLAVLALRTGRVAALPHQPGLPHGLFRPP
ncbi:MAG: hypothetical protein P4M09_12235, partial [Devosia sp.]|nr:hypothetical protein [Devosia sp.]